MINTEDEFKTWVEEMTGGPSGCQIPHGGTCQCPDIRTAGQDLDCDGCQLFKYCLVPSKKILDRKQNRK